MKWGKTSRPPLSEIEVHQLSIVFNEIKTRGEITFRFMRQASIEYSLYNLGNRENIAKIIEKLGDRLTVPGQMDTSFCADKLKLRYSDYTEDGKVFLRATLEQIDKAVLGWCHQSNELANRCDGWERKFVDLEKQHEVLYQEHCELSQQVDTLTQQNNELDRHISDILNSNTWKIGKRLSRVYRFISLKKAFILLLIIVITVNIVQFGSADRQAPEIFKALYNFHESDIFMLYDRQLTNRFALLMDLADITDNVNIIIYKGHERSSYGGPAIINESWLNFYVNRGSIEVLEYEPHTFLDTFDPTPYIVKTSEDKRTRLNYRIAVNTQNSEANEFIILMWHDDIVLFLDTSLLPEGKTEELRMMSQ